MSVKLTAANQLRTTRLSKVETESPTVKTFTFHDRLCAEAMPGQFLMLWIPGIDEIPLSILGTESDGHVSVVVKNVGEATLALHNMKTGQVVGVRGPFGNSFTENKGNVLMVGGGTGMGPLLFLAKQLGSKPRRLVFIVGAKTKAELLFTDDLERFCKNGKIVVTTDDGSHGLRCMATEPARALFVREEFDMVYTCGPERMMVEVFDLAEKHGVPLEASLERLMRCAMGLCGSCVIGKYRVCRDGPVFSSEQLRTVRNEFGRSKLDFDGRRIPV